MQACPFTSLGMLISDKPIMGLRKGGKLLTKDSFGDELSALMKRLPGEPKYGAFKHPADVAGEQPDDEEEEYEESDEEVPPEVWNDDIDDAADSAHPTEVTVSEDDAADGEESAGEGDMGEDDMSVSPEEKDDDDDLTEALNRRRRQLKSARVPGKSWADDVHSTNSSEVDNDGSDYETVSAETSDSVEDDSSQSVGDVLDYEGMPADAKNRKILSFSPEDQRRIKFRQ